MHVDDAYWLYDPRGHVGQLAAPSVSPKVPALQGVQLKDFVLFLYVRKGHLKQDEAPVILLEVPSGQIVQGVVTDEE